MLKLQVRAPLSRRWRKAPSSLQFRLNLRINTDFVDGQATPDYDGPMSLSNPDLYAPGGYVVLDFETTGFSFDHGDRVLEVGVVKLDPEGRIVGTFETLINPMRHVGATEIHGISASDVVAAPAFGDIADHFAAILDGSVFVAHNASFDARFAHGELTASGNFLGKSIPYLCTMTLAKQYKIGRTAKLSDVTLALGVRNSHAHSALADAIATAQVLEYFLRETSASKDPLWRKAVAAASACADYRHGELTEDPLHITRADAARAREALRSGAWVNKAVGARDIPDESLAAQYFRLLDAVFLDRDLSAAEERQLLEFAAQNQLSSVALADIHQRYLRSLVEAAWADGVVTPEERETVEVVGRYLGISPEDREAGLPTTTAPGAPAVVPVPTPEGEAESAPESSPEGAVRSSLLDSCIMLAPGDRVTVTGPVLRTHAEWEALLGAHGVAVAGLAKKTKVLIAGDINSMSGKAKKAHDYGIPVISEAAADELIRFTEGGR